MLFRSVWDNDNEVLLPAERKRKPDVLIGLSKEVIPSPMREDEAEECLKELGDSGAGSMLVRREFLNS